MWPRRKYTQLLLDRAREGRYVIRLLNLENDWDDEVDCTEVIEPYCLISEEEVAAAIKGLKSSWSYWCGECDDEGRWWFLYKVDD